jgi:hypothetical protein
LQHADDAKLAEELYLTVFARPPTEAERKTAVEYLSQAASGDRRARAEDLVWSMLNSLEFVFNH